MSVEILSEGEFKYICVISSNFSLMFALLKGDLFKVFQKQASKKKCECGFIMSTVSTHKLIMQTSQLNVSKSFDLTLAYIIGMSRIECKHKSASILQHNVTNSCIQSHMHRILKTDPFVICLQIFFMLLCLFRAVELSASTNKDFGSYVLWYSLSAKFHLILKDFS